MEEEPGAKYSYSSTFFMGAHSVTEPETVLDLQAVINHFLEQFALEESLAKSRKRAL